MRKITLYVGLSDKDTKTQKIDTLAAYGVINNILQADATISECRGIYTHEGGDVVIENTLQIVLLDFTGAMSRAWVTEKANAIKAALNQESVAAQFEEVKSELL